ncbi:TetR/AcrR family transcriptional regulator [Actinomadura rudentiformis]|uniref:TetR/AcrR family transcriptional regulator n=1 Tax=Actinomadura rudentiformis TaxID=359158 RepID=A0A6H9YZ51_9ACTN|nr:TetR/AcrR family transcriptional regulator [Actinomadura rudentiformis]KAB2350667.1 TetR/AcrR family transcriptional regulator [Actinomadura rudentiformis]
MSADERREETVRVAICEFGRSGYEGTSTAAIAKRVGVSQPYLFRLFPSKRALFLAAVERCFDDMEEAMRESAGGKYGQEAIVAMGMRYREMLDSGVQLKFQLQLYATALDDKEVRQIGNARWAKLWRTIAELTGESADDILHFVSRGMLLNVLTALDVPYTPGPGLGRSLLEWSENG